MDSVKTQEFKLEVDSELRFEIEKKDNKITVEVSTMERMKCFFTIVSYRIILSNQLISCTFHFQLKSGFAELFGTELVKSKQYEFTTGAKVAIFTYQGCVLSVVGHLESHYIAKETPMIQYLNCHAALEELRKHADETNGVGPNVMVVGPTDVGKSTLCRILLNYAVRQGRRPIYVDLDVGQGRVSVPGTLSALLIERPAKVEDDFSQQAPLVYNFGGLSPSDNDSYFDILTSRLAEVTLERLNANQQGKSSGIIINTCGWIRGGGYYHILHTAKAFDVSAIFVLDQERLYNELLRDLNKSSVEVVFLQKSGGVVKRSKNFRSESRDQRIREYFYGKHSPLYPHSFDVKWTDIKICKVGAPALPDSCMPLGMRAEDNKTKVMSVQPSMSLMHHLLALTYAENIDDNIINSNVAGFACV